ncbi:MAG: hypothetical protein PHG34_08955 [Candidatus Cloacimonetes bacterium]|nr:hypothetical protein [Candidatus Cloacimonadota bacterium]
MEYKNNYKEKKRRSDIIFGILLASTLGVLLNLFSNLYYDLSVSKIVKLNGATLNHLIVWIFILLATWGFISFFIYDYENNVEINKAHFWKRFINYFFKSFKPFKILKIITGIYLITFIVFLIFILLITLFFIMNGVTNWLFASVLIAFILVGLVLNVYKKYLKK